MNKRTNRRTPGTMVEALENRQYLAVTVAKVTVSAGKPTSSVSAPSTPAIAPQAQITVTDGATILPGESVHVQSLNSVFGDGGALQSTVQWDFGDPNAAFNQLTGFNAAHAYDRPGVYKVTLKITNQSGLVSTATTTVNVAADNRQTIYVAADGNDNNDGLTPATAIQSAARLDQMVSSNTRVLLHDGDTFNVSSDIDLRGNDIDVSSYGQGPQPILKYVGPEGQDGSIFTILPGSEGITVQGLTFDSIYVNALDDNPFDSGIFVNGSNITIRDNTFLNMWYDMDLAGQPNNVLIQNNASPTTTGLRKYFVWVQGNDIVLVGNSAANSTRESIVRVAGANRVLIEDNSLLNISGATPGDAEDGIKASIAVQYGTYAYVADNFLPSGGVMGVGPLDNPQPAGAPTPSFEYAVFTQNQMNATMLVQAGAHHVLISNNVLTTNNEDAFDINGQGQNVAIQAQDIYIVHNTVFNNGPNGPFINLENGEAQGVTVDYNLFVAPNFVTGNGNSIIYVANNDLNSFTEIKNNIWPVPQTPSSFGPNSYYYVNSTPAVQSGNKTVAQWQALGVGQGDIYQNVTLLLAGVYTYTINGLTAGAVL